MTPKLDAIGIVAQDMAAAVRFYRMLGLAFPDAGASPHLEVTTPGGLRVMLDDLALIKSIMPDWTPPSGHRMGLAFLCETPAAVDATYAAVVAAGFAGKTPPWDAFWGQRYAQVVDPDGNVVDLFAPLEQ
jgi:uncharacterized glyoxalase superfamily protein PhnB